MRIDSRHRDSIVPSFSLFFRWEKFAAEKGIKKRKRSKMVWDETQQEWRRAPAAAPTASPPFPAASCLSLTHFPSHLSRGRHGYNRVDDPNDIPIIEAKSWEQEGAEDPFAAQARDKKQRVAAQEGRQVKNLQVRSVVVVISPSLRQRSVLLMWCSRVFWDVAVSDTHN